MRYRIPARVGYVVHEPTLEQPTATVYLLRLPDGQPLVLSGTAALIWVLAAEGEPNVPAALAELVGEALSTVESPTLSYLDNLVLQGLLTEAPDAEPAP